mgnify:CR=1 FL=1
MAQIIHFSKIFPDADAAALIRCAEITGAEGYDLAVRPGYAVGPDNVEELPVFVKILRAANLAVPMITAPGDFLSPQNDLAPRYLKAMAEAEAPYSSVEGRSDMFSVTLSVIPIVLILALVMIQASVRILRECERAVVLSLGRFQA